MRGRDFRFSRKTANSRARFARVFYENIALAKSFPENGLKSIHLVYWELLEQTQSLTAIVGRV
jgi:hypothetical protein